MLHKPVWKLSWKQYLTSLTTNVNQVVTMQLLHVFQLHILLPILPQPNNLLPCWFFFPPFSFYFVFLVFSIVALAIVFFCNILKYYTKITTYDYK